MLIELTRGKHAVVDVNDADLAGRSWHAVPGLHSIGNYTFYSVRRKGNKRVTLHRVILKRILGRHLQEGEECDHWNIRNSHSRQHITKAGQEHKQLKLNSVSHQDQQG